MLWLLVYLLERWKRSIDPESYTEIVFKVAAAGRRSWGTERRQRPDSGKAWEASVVAARRFGLLVTWAASAFDSLLCTDRTGPRRSSRALVDELQAHEQAAQRVLDAPEQHGLTGFAPQAVGVALEARAVALRDRRIVEHRPPGTAISVTRWTVAWQPSGIFHATREGRGSFEEGLAGCAPTPRSMVEMAQWWQGGPVEIAYRDRAPSPPERLLDAMTTHPYEVPLLEHWNALANAKHERSTVERQEFDVACRDVRARLRESDVAAALASAASRLQRESPQPPCSAISDSHIGPTAEPIGSLVGIEWVRTERILTTVDPVWGEFDRRPQMPRHIARSLVAAQTGHGPGQDAFVAELFGDPLDLIKRAAWAGPVYGLGSNGSHRIFTLKALGLPWALATVSLATVDPVIELVDLIDPDRAVHEACDELLALWRGLLRRGVIAGRVEEDQPCPWLARLVWTSLPASWLLRDASTATSCNAAYERCYPGAMAGLGVPEDVAFDAASWAAWLVGTPRRARVATSGS